MKLQDLLPESANSALSELEVTDVTADVDLVQAGGTFVCIGGQNTDGHTFARKAVQKGAAVIIAQRDTGCENQLIVRDTRESYAALCSGVFENAHKDLKLIGVTGTNGKTTVTYLLKAILEGAGFKTGLIGTNKNLIGDTPVVAKRTTPDAYELHSLLYSMRMAGCEYVVMEISSHALDQKRVHGLRFDIAVFTNLTQDHLDYHGTMDNYFAAKYKLFEMADKGVLNYDDEHAKKILELAPCKCITYSAVDDRADYTAKNIRYRADGVDFELVGMEVIGRVRFGTPGKFSVYNALAAGVASLAAGMPFSTMITSLSHVRGVKGRMEVVPTGRDFTVIIDYAHTPDGLENALGALRQVKKGRLVTLFGCGGDRDRIKRPLMGEIAARLSDMVIVTSDNPRGENPKDIMKDILKGMKQTSVPHIIIENRVQAIEYAVKHAQPNDLILLAGKGHETYQVLDKGTVHLDEREVVADALSSIKGADELLY